MSEIIIFQAEDGKTCLDVQLEQETVWLNLKQMVDLFGRDKSVVSRHLGNIFREEERDRNGILDDQVRSAISPNKIGWQKWLEVMERAHNFGLQTTATIMFGSTMIEENVVAATGVHFSISLQELIDTIKEACFKPLLRDTLYNQVKEF